MLPTYYVTCKFSILVKFIPVKCQVIQKIINYNILLTVIIYNLFGNKYNLGGTVVNVNVVSFDCRYFRIVNEGITHSLV